MPDRTTASGTGSRQQRNTVGMVFPWGLPESAIGSPVPRQLHLLSGASSVRLECKNRSSILRHCHAQIVTLWLQMAVAVEARHGGHAAPSLGWRYAVN
jgi:hypothetical protein